MRRKTLATRCGRQPLGTSISQQRFLVAVSLLNFYSLLRLIAAASASAKYDFDLFTIGAGSGGVRASRVSAQYGAKVGVRTSGDGHQTLLASASV